MKGSNSKGTGQNGLVTGTCLADTEMTCNMSSDKEKVEKLKEKKYNAYIRA